MSLIKPVLCSVICILFFSTLTAQLSLKKVPINNVVNENFYSGKRWNVKQILKDSVLFQYVPIFTHGYVLQISRFSMISLSIIEDPAALVQPGVSDKLQSHLKTSRFYESDTYFHTNFTSCWSLNFPQKYKRPIVGKFFFNYQ